MRTEDKLGKEPQRLSALEERLFAVINEAGEEGMHGSEAAEAANVPVNNAYVALRRMLSKGFLRRNETLVPFGKSHLRRVVYTRTPNVKEAKTWIIA